MQSSEVRYHKSTEHVDDEAGGGDDRGGGRRLMPSLTFAYSRFTVLERVLLIVICVIFVLAVVFGVLYGTARTKYEIKTTRLVEDNTCLTAECVKISADIMQSVDWTTNPCNDFYKFSCSKWEESHEIDDFRSSLSQFGKLSQENNNFVKTKLDNNQTLNKYKKDTAVSKALIDYYSCLKAEKKEESLGFQPLYDLIKQYGSWNITDPAWRNSKWELMSNLVDNHRNLSIMPLFAPVIGEDLKNSSNHIIKIFPTKTWYKPRDMYVKNASLNNKMRTSYKTLILSVITKLANTTKENPDMLRQMEDIYNFEQRLAQISMTTEEAWKMEENYKKVTIKELQEYTGKTFNWLDYFQRLFREVNVDITEESFVGLTELDYFRNMSSVLESTNDVVIGNYLIWTVICGMKTFLSKTLRDDFQNHYKIQLGTRKESPRWKTCLQLTKKYLGLPLSMLYLNEKFGENQMKQVEEMVTGIREVLVDNLQSISWMDEETKKAAIKKAKTIKENIGYPKILLDQEKFNKKYEELEIDEKDYFGNNLRKRKFQAKETLKKILQPVDKSEWSLNPISVNAVYSPTENKIVFPAGVLQSPFYEVSRPKSLNYGAIGMVIGHELTHSFDNRGRKYDENGNLVDWWQNSSVIEFKNRTECLVKKYSKYTFHKYKVNGRNTLDENIADNGGIKQAFQAYERWTKIHGEEPKLPALNLTNHQLFFVGFSQVWCTKYRETIVKNVVQKQSHAPSMIRVLGSLSNFPEFSKAFQCPLGARMNAFEKCNVW